LEKASDKVRNAMSDNGSRLEVSMKIDCPKGCEFKATQGRTPAAVTVMIRKKRDDALTDANGRFWCGSARIPLAVGTYRVACPLDRSAWTNVDGQKPSSEEWNNTLKNLGEVGVTFGGTFYGHGVRMSSGSDCDLDAQVRCDLIVKGQEGGTGGYTREETKKAKANQAER
jgi:hypothetical protein